MKLKIVRATTSKTVRLYCQDTSSTTGGGLTGLTSASAGLTCYYIREGDASATAVPLSGGTVGTWSSGGFKEVDSVNLPGLYELGLPNAALSTGNSVVVMLKGATNLAPTLLEIELDAVNYQSATAFITGVNSLAPPTNWNLASLDSSGRTLLQPTQTGVTIPTVTALTNAPADSAGVGTLLTRVPNTLPSFPTNFASFSIDASGRALLQPVQAFNNTGQTTAPAWLGVASVLLTSDHTAIAADAQTGLTAQGYTATRAGYLDTLNGLVAAIWGNVTRSLTTFGTLTTDAATAVWAAGTRTLSAFGFAVAASNLPTDYARNNIAPSWWVSPDNADVATSLADLVSLLARTDPTTALSTLQNAATAIKAKTDQMTFTGGNVNAATQTLPSPAPPSYGASGSIAVYGTAGAIAYTYTIFDVGGVTPLPGAAVYVSADSAGTQRSQTKVTDSLGRVTFQLDAGTVFFWASHPDRTFSNPVTEVIGP